MELLSCELHLGRAQVAIRERRIEEAKAALRAAQEDLLGERVIGMWEGRKAQAHAAEATAAIARAISILRQNDDLEYNPNRNIYASEYTTLAQLEVHSAEVAEGRR